MESNTTNRKINLRSSDGVEFVVDEEVAKLCQTICHMIEVDCAWDTIPIPNVTGNILAKVFKYCKKHVKTDVATEEEAKKSDQELQKWDRSFLDVDQETLFELMKAANYLDIKGLLQLTCQQVADMMRGKSLETIRETFNIRNDLSAEEEDEIRHENWWAFV